MKQNTHVKKIKQILLNCKCLKQKDGHKKYTKLYKKQTKYLKKGWI